MSEQLSTALINKTQISHNIYSFFFRRPSGFSFKPGQYLRMILPHENVDDRGSSRFFTISSSPLEKHLMITTKLRESTFKRTLLNIKIGQEVLIFGPMGQFYLDENPIEPVVFLAGGMGITPYRSMITYLHRKRIKTNATLIACFRDIEDLIFHNELKHIAEKNKFINIIYILTGTSKKNSAWSHEQGRLSAGLIKRHIPNFIKSKYYITGPESMVNSSAAILKDMGISASFIITEKFTGY